MTTKYLTGAYPAGYAIQSGVTSLDITATATVGGYGVRAGNNAVQIDNEGSVQATEAYGVEMSGGSAKISSVVNGESNAHALIEGSVTGLAADYCRLNNFGTIVGLGTQYERGHVVAGVGLFGFGSSATNGSANDTTALIQGGYIGFNGGGAVPLTNFGTILGINASGVQDASTVTNGSSADHLATIRGGGDGVSGFSQLYNFGAISGGSAGVYDENDTIGETTALTNFGTISGDGTQGQGVVLLGRHILIANGRFSDPAAIIEGHSTGVLVRADYASITNYGTILATGATGYGVSLNSEGIITNGSVGEAAPALIEGAVGVSIQVNGGNVATLKNFGVIRGATAAGIMVGAQYALIVNGSSKDRAASITGAYPSLVSGKADTVINFGTMSALRITNDRSVLEVERGSIFEGPVIDVGTVAFVTGTGTLSGLTGTQVSLSEGAAASTFIGFGTLQIGSKGRKGGELGDFTLTGSGEIVAGQTLAVDGRLLVMHDLTDAGAATGTGVIALAARAKAVFDHAVPASLTVSFQGGRSLLDLADPSQFGSTIAGMVRHGKIDLLGIAADSAVLEAGDKLVITDQGQAVATLQLAGNFGSETFTAASDGAGGTFISVVRQGGADPPAAPPRPAVLASAAAAMGAHASAHAAPTFHAGYATRLIAAPRVQTA